MRRLQAEKKISGNNRLAGRGHAGRRLDEVAERSSGDSETADETVGEGREPVSSQAK
jgi:hypothetical protein